MEILSPPKFRTPLMALSLKNDCADWTASYCLYRACAIFLHKLNEHFCFCQESQFNVKVESPSPGGHALHMGEDQDTSPSKLSKEELIQSMDRVDREIAKVEQQIFKLKKKQVGYKIKPFVSEHSSNTMDVV